MSEMVERVTRAICAELFKMPDIYWGDDPILVAVDSEWPQYRDAAIAALAAMREPTEAMKIAADAAMDDSYYWDYEVREQSDSGRVIYQAMIDEALK